MDCIVANCTASCLALRRRWILDPTISFDEPGRKPTPTVWVSSYLQLPRRSYASYVTEKVIAGRVFDLSA